MDRSFSITSSITGSGALRQYHQHQAHHHQPSVRNSLSPSVFAAGATAEVPHYQQYQQQQQLCPSSPTFSSPVVKAQTTPAGFSIAFGQETHHLAPVGYHPETAGSLQVHQGLAVPPGSGTFFGVGVVPSGLQVAPQQQQQQHQHQQQQYQYQRQRTTNSFVPVSSSVGGGAASASVSEASCYGGQQTGGTGYQNRSRSDQSPHHHQQQQHPLRVSTGSRSNCGQQQQQQQHVDRSSSTHKVQGQQQQYQSASNYSGSSSNNHSHPPVVTSNSYSYHSVDGGHQQEAQYRQRQQYSSSVSQEQQYHQSSSSVSSPAQMPNNHHQSHTTQNMNKNRYGSQTAAQHQQQPPPPVTASINSIMVSQASPGDNINSPGSGSNVKQMLNQQIQKQQQNELNNEISSSNSPHHPLPQQAHPQYRIFKRGDSIPGISSPIQISPPGTSNSTTPTGVTGDNANTAGNDNGNLNSLESTDTNAGGNNGESDSNNGGSDKENSNRSNENTAVPSSGNANNGNGGSGTGGGRTPLSQVGEIARFHSINVSYRLVKETGPPHAPTFTVVLELGNEEYSGEGASIKKAQHAAAEEALEKTTLERPPPKMKSKKPYSVSGLGSGGGKRPNWALIQLTNLVQELQLPLQFVQQPVPIMDPFKKGDPPSIVCVHVGDKIFSGEGSNFNAAKNTAVMVALKAMLKVKQEADLAKMAQVGADAELSMMEAENKSPISIVHEMAMKRGLSVSFVIIEESGPPHMKTFTVNCKVGEELETEGEGPTKQAAKKASSANMIKQLKEIPITLPATSQGMNLKAMQRGLLRQKSAKKKTSTPVLKDLEKQAVSPISRLIQIAHIKKFKEPEFTLISTGTESNVENFLKQITERDRRMLRKKKPVFTIEVTVGPHTCQGTGPNKKAAKKAAAEAAVIAFGYGPTEDPSSEDAVDSPQQSTEQSLSTTTPSGKSKGSKGNKEGKTVSPTVKLAGAKQIAPGIIVLKSEPVAGAATSAAAVQEMKKVGSMMTPCPATSSREGIDKLAYLSKLLEIAVSYSDFPKKNEYLSVVSLTTNPPHVAHGCGATLEEAQNAAALKILEELSTKGLDSVTAAAEKPSET